MAKTDLFRQLINQLIIPVCLGFLFLGIYVFYQTQNHLSKAYQLKNQILTKEIIHLMDFQDLALEIHEELLEKRMKDLSKIIVEQYIGNNTEAEKIDLEKIRNRLGMNPDFEDIYIINRAGIIVNTTFKKDLGLNFFNFGENHKNYLLTLFDSPKFVSERFTIETHTKRLRKYTYQPSLNGQYIIELGTYSKKADEIIDFIKSHINKLSFEHESIKSVDLFIMADQPFSLNHDALLIPAHAAALKDAFILKEQVSFKVTEERKILKYDYNYLDIRNTDLYKGAVLRIITDISKDQKILRIELLKILTFFVLLILVIILLIYRKTKDIIKPLDQLVDNIKAINLGNYSKRVDVDGNNEVAELSREFNNMLDILETRNKETREQHEEIESQKQMLLEANKNLERLSVVANKTTNAVSIFDPNGNLIWFNDGFYKVYGYTFNEVIYNIGDHITKIFNNMDIDKYISICVNTKQPVDFEIEVKTKADKTVWIQTTLSPLLDEENNVTGLVAIDTNISALKNIEMKLTQNNKDITDSIHYAKRIQEAILPEPNHIKDFFSDYFILHKPKGIVSGDFFWYHIDGQRIYLAAADCTGHGIPGAFLSIVGNNLLNKIINENPHLIPDRILTLLDQNLHFLLNQNRPDLTQRDRINLAMCLYNPQNLELYYSGSFSPLYIISKKDIDVDKGGIKIKIYREPYNLYEIKPNRFVSDNISQNIYSTKKVLLNKEDIIYLFTDGFADQFGGPSNKKFKYSHFKELILEIQDNDFKKQKEILSARFDEWKGEQEQVDDLLILGLRI